MSEQALSFMSEHLEIEGVIHDPKEGGAKLPGVAFCHPHTLYGGDMHNNVVVAVSRMLAEKGIYALRFNFRGAGSSEGAFDEGKGEQNDLQAALNVLIEHPGVDPDCLGVAGYSFGGLVTLMAAKKLKQVRALAAVSPVVIPGLMEDLSLPAYFICGARDNVVSPDLLMREAEKISPPGEVEILEGIDHFWGGFEKEMAEKVVAFFTRIIGS